VKPINKQKPAKAMQEKDGELGVAPEPKKYKEQQPIMEKPIPQTMLQVLLMALVISIKLTVLPYPEIHRDRIIAPPRDKSRDASLWDMIIKATQIIYQFSKYQPGFLKDVCPMILQVLKKGNKEITNALVSGVWSNGAMVMNILEAGESENQKAIVSIILGYMWAWE
jgi:hypothetical protein